VFIALCVILDLAWLVAGRAKVVASGTFEGTVEAQAAFVNRMGKEVDAVVVLINQMAKVEEGNAVWKTNVQKLLDLTGDVPLGRYSSVLRGLSKL
jgi:4-hydroxy-tetrahydrodipicolinate synthase